MAREFTPEAIAVNKSDLAWKKLTVLQVARSSIAENYRKRVDSRAMRLCVVSYLDASGIRHSVELQAESVFEPAVLAVKTLREHHCAPGEISKLEVEIRSS